MRGKTNPHNTKKTTVVLNAVKRSFFSIGAALKRVRLNILRAARSIASEHLTAYNPRSRAVRASDVANHVAVPICESHPVINNPASGLVYRDVERGIPHIVSLIHISEPTRLGMISY